MSIKSFSSALVFIVIFFVFTLIGVSVYCDKNAKKKNATAAPTLPTHHSRSHHRRTANQGLAQSNVQSQRIHFTLSGDLLAQVNAARTMQDGSMRLVPLTHPPVEDPVVRTASSSATQLPEYAPVAPPIPPAPAYQAPLRVRNVDPADLSTSTVNTIPPDVPRAPPPAYNTVVVGGGGSAV